MNRYERKQVSLWNLTKHYLCMPALFVCLCFCIHKQSSLLLLIKTLGFVSVYLFQKRSQRCLKLGSDVLNIKSAIKSQNSKHVQFSQKQMIWAVLYTVTVYSYYLSGQLMFKRRQFDAKKQVKYANQTDVKDLTLIWCKLNVKHIGLQLNPWSLD